MVFFSSHNFASSTAVFVQYVARLTDNCDA